MKKALKIILNIFIVFIILSLGVFLLTNPKVSAAGIIKGLDICTYHLIPALFPFMVVASFIMDSGLYRYIGSIFYKPFNKMFCADKNSSCIIFLSFLSGFPAPAKLIGMLNEKKLCSKKNCEYMLGFCNNASPIFVISVAGAAIFKSAFIGVIIFSIHILSAVITGIIYKKAFNITDDTKIMHTENNTHTEKPRILSCLMTSISSSAAAMLSVCAFVTFFSAVTNMINHAGVNSFIINKLSLEPDSIVNVLINGFFEVTGGVIASSGVLNPINTACVCAVLSFSGLSVLCQVTYFADKYQLSIKKYCIMKITSAFISFVIMFVFMTIFTLII